MLCVRSSCSRRGELRSWRSYWQVNIMVAWVISQYYFGLQAYIKDLIAVFWFWCLDHRSTWSFHKHDVVCLGSKQVGVTPRLQRFFLNLWRLVQSFVSVLPEWTTLTAAFWSFCAIMATGWEFQRISFLRGVNIPQRNPSIDAESRRTPIARSGTSPKQTGEARLPGQRWWRINLLAEEVAS